MNLNRVSHFKQQSLNTLIVTLIGHDFEYFDVELLILRGSSEDMSMMDVHTNVAGKTESARLQ